MLIMLFVSFVALLFLGVPIAYAIGLASFITIAASDLGTVTMVIQRTYGTLDSYTLLAIPFFVLAGDLMSRGGMSQRMINFSNVVVGRLRGGLAQVSVLASMIFAGVSGSGAADASAIGSILIPTMKKQGYTAGWVAALQASAGTIGPIIPPSIIMIVYGSMTGVSIGAMFLGGAIPGILIGLGLMLVVYGYSFFPGYEFLKASSGYVGGDLMATVKDGFLTLITPGIIIGGIVFGVFTATEGGAIATAYAFIIGFFVYKELKLADLEAILISSAVTSAVVLLVTGVAGAFGWILTYNQFPADIADFLLGITTDKTYMLTIIVVFLLILTCFVETLPALIMMTPVFYQISTQLQYDPVYFGVVVCIAAFMGTVTPPVGVLLYVTTSIAGCPLKETVRYLPVFLVVLFTMTFVVTWVPILVTFLPHLLLK